MKNSIRQKLFLFSFLILAGNGFLGYVIYKSNQKLLDSEHWVQHTEQVISQTAGISSIGKDVETASRGFVITNDSAFLKPLYYAERTILVNIGQLRYLTRDNPGQQQRIDSLKLYVHKRLNFSYQTIKIRSKEGLIPAIAYVSTKQGDYYTERIRQICNAIQQEEEDLLKQRRQTNGRSEATFNRFTVIMFILMTGISVLLLIAIGKYWFQNEEKEIRAAELIIANKELAYQNGEKEKRSEELIIANNGLRKAEEDIRKLNREDIRKLNEELEQKVLQRTEQLESVNKELESFSYSVSHDLRAPLRAVNGYAKMIEEDYNELFDDEGKRLLSVVQENAKKMGQLIDDLLAFSKLGRKEIVKSMVNMTAIAKNSLEELKSSQQIKARVIIDDLHPGFADGTLMHQVWANLLSNAIKYSFNTAKPVIKVKSEKINNELTYSVADNGVGFDMKYAHKLFGVFQRLHDPEDFEGTGLGLALVHRIITKQGGKIWAVAEAGKGATFFFSLPENSLKHKTFKHGRY